MTAMHRNALVRMLRERSARKARLASAGRLAVMVALFWATAAQAQHPHPLFPTAGTWRFQARALSDTSQTAVMFITVDSPDAAGGTYRLNGGSPDQMKLQFHASPP